MKDLTCYPSKNELISDLIQKISNNKKEAEIMHACKLLLNFTKLLEAFSNIVLFKCKCNVGSEIDIHYLLMSKIKVYVNVKNCLDDRPIPIIKKELLEY